MPRAFGTAGSQYVKVEGLSELRKALRKLEDDVDKKGLQQTLKAEFREAAELVVTAAYHRAPLKSGRLRNTIRPKGALKGATVLAGGINGVVYAGPIEYGWPTRPNPAKGWRGGPITKSRFLGRGLYARRDAIRDLMERSVAKLLEQVKGL